MDRAWFTNLANASASLNAQLQDVNWVGFYLFDGKELVLGPFQGLSACLRIPLSKGVCGAAASSRKTVRVADVSAFPGHISCDTRSQAEIVVPMIFNGRLLGVLDVDSPIQSRFDQQDQIGLEQIVATLIEGTVWPEKFL